MTWSLWSSSSSDDASDAATIDDKSWRDLQGRAAKANPEVAGHVRQRGHRGSPPGPGQLQEPEEQMMDVPDEAWVAAHSVVDPDLDEAVTAAAPHIQAPLLARIADLEAKLAESERLAGVLREQRNKAEDELRGRA